MNLLALVFFIINAIALWMVPRKYAPIPLLIGCCYMTIGQGIHLGPISLPIFRMLMTVGLFRVALIGERIAQCLNKIDWLIISLAGWLLFASLFHSGMNGSGPLFMLGMLFNITLSYFLIRVWTRDMEELADLVKMIAFLLAPLALAMMVEKLTSHNLFSLFGGVPEISVMREGKYRAQGPFRHSILAGTVGATCFPLFVGIYKINKTSALLGMVSGVAIVLFSSSSGPVMSLFAGIFALIMWIYRKYTRRIVLAAGITYAILMAVMNRPPYYLISKIDISGGSTGWHRAYLIEQTFKHLSEWWLFGTDTTRHWMPGQGIGMWASHTDITNYYIAFGVMGGLSAMCLMICVMIVAFKWVGITSSSLVIVHKNHAFMIWAFGSGLFAHAATSISVAYFDQSMMFFWINIAVISSVYSSNRHMFT